MTLSRYESYVNFVRRVTSTDLLNLFDTPMGGLESPPGNIIAENRIITALQCYASVKSLPSVEMPSYPITMSDSERVIADLNLEWESPRFVLRISGVDQATNSSVTLSEMSLINISPYPYRVYDLLKAITGNGTPLKLAPNFYIGIQVLNAGFGGLYVIDDDGVSDIINVSACINREIWIEEQTIINVTVPNSYNAAPITINNNIQGAAIATTQKNPAIKMINPTLTSGTVAITSANRALMFNDIGTVALNLDLANDSQIEKGSEFMVYGYNTEPMNGWDEPSRIFTGKICHKKGPNRVMLEHEVTAECKWLAVFIKFPRIQDWSTYGAWHKAEFSTAMFNSDNALVATISDIWMESFPVY